ncbi:MAG: type II toxin-antitoxin system VapC family toxin [Candidatus Acidiferrum sp.]
MGSRKKVILLDTHVLVWVSGEPSRLSKQAASAIRRANRAGGMAVSAITLWELAWLASHGRLLVTGTVEAYLEEVSSLVAIRPITSKIAALANQFPTEYSSDQCDRLIGATALAEGMVLVTKDTKIRDCKQLRTVW